MKAFRTNHIWLLASFNPWSTSLLLLLLLPLLLATAGCQDKKGKVESGTEDGLDRRSQIRLKHYLVEGQRLYMENCSNCHQKDGTGLGRLIPPLKDADYLKADVNRTVCIVKYGLSGEIIVNGQDYNHEMPGNKALTELEIAEVVTYVYNTWGEMSEIIPVERVREALKQCRKQ